MFYHTKLKEYRIAKGFTQEQLAKALGLAKSTISMYENGNREPDFETIEAIADILNINLNLFFSKDTENNTLTADETKLLTGYRSLSDQGKEYIRQTLTMAQQVYKKSDPIPRLDNKIG